MMVKIVKQDQTVKVFVKQIHYNKLISFIRPPMIVLVLTHVLVAWIVWIVTKQTTNNKRSVGLHIHQAPSYSWAKTQEDHHRKKKPKKAKKKHRKYETIEVLSHPYKQQTQEQPASDSQKQQQTLKILHTEKTLQQQENKHSDHQFDQSTKKNNQWSQSINEEAQRDIGKVQQTASIQKVSQSQSDRQRKLKVSQEVDLLRNYFLLDLEEIVPYNGHYGHYALLLEGTNKSLSLQWEYNSLYPNDLIDIKINKQALNPLQLQVLQSILLLNQNRLKRQPHYPYIFNITTAIYQDLMLTINYPQQQSKLEHSDIHSPSRQANHSDHQPQNSTQFNLYKKHINPQDIKLKKEIYGKILDQIFYLHDMIEEPDSSAMKIQQNEEAARVKQHNARGRYESQFEELQLIGEGGFGKVYKVRHKLDGNIYAIKKAVVNYEDLNDRKMLKEVALLSKLNHPNIVRYYQSWLEDTNSIQELVQDMSFSQNEQSKISELNNIYKDWKNNRSGIRFSRGSSHGNSYQGELVENSGIVFEEEQDNGIVFEEQQMQEMEVSGGSSIGYAGLHARNDSQSSVIDGLEGFPFKILYIAMQLCSGINLRQFINHNFDDEEQKIQLLRGILEGLAYIHSKHIIHRDLKPANIFLTDQNKVKIGDFGLATSQERSVCISIEQDDNDLLGDKTKAVGTGFYRAPEQLKSQKYDQKVDIYSLGIIIFELFYPFKTAMERMDVLKQLTLSHKLPKDFQGEHAGTDVVENIEVCLRQNPEQRPSASKLLEGFRNKYFTQLVSCIANPKHFQFSELLSHLFAIRNEMGSPLMWRDLYKNYMTNKILKIYQIHRATHFPTLPLIPVQDFHMLNAQKIKATRNGKYLLLTERGVILEYASNTLKSWLKYAKDAIRRKKIISIDEQRQAIRRFSFEKIVSFQIPANKEESEYHQNMVTAFDICYKLDQGFKAFYLCQILKVSAAIVLTLNLTQKKPPIFMSHSLIFKLLALKFHIATETLYHVFLSTREDQFNSLPFAKRVNFLQERNLPSNFAKKYCQIMDLTFDSGLQLLQCFDFDRDSDIYKQVEAQMTQISKLALRIIQNPIRWKLELPPSSCNGFYWQVGIVKGLTSVEEYANGQELCNYHIQTTLDHEPSETDVSLWCIGEYLEEEMQRLIVECWKNGLATRWYEWQVGENEDMKCRHNILLRRKNERVQVMVRHNQARKGEHREERQSSFISLQQFNWDVIKQMATVAYPKFYH